MTNPQNIAELAEYTRVREEFLHFARAGTMACVESAMLNVDALIAAVLAAQVAAAPQPAEQQPGAADAKMAGMKLRQPAPQAEAVAHLTIAYEREDMNSVGWKMTKAGYALEPGEYDLYAALTAATAQATPDIPLSCRDSHEASLKYVEGYEAGMAAATAQAAPQATAAGIVVEMPDDEDLEALVKWRGDKADPYFDRLEFGRAVWDKAWMHASVAVKLATPPQPDAQAVQAVGQLAFQDDPRNNADQSAAQRAAQVAAEQAEAPTTPKAAPEALTDDAIWSLHQELLRGDPRKATVVTFARLIERAHGIGSAVAAPVGRES